MSQEYKYPHQISLLGCGECDVCQTTDEDTQILGVTGCPFVGFRICSDAKCIDTAEAWLNQICIPYDELTKEFGSWVYIQRSSKRLEHGWVIIGDAYQTTKAGPLWVTVRNNKRHLTKIVTLEKLREWNKVKILNRHTE